jgi:hypothetical protein
MKARLMVVVPLAGLLLTSGAAFAANAQLRPR